MQPRSSSSRVCTGGVISRIFRPRMSHKCSRGFKSGLRAHGPGHEEASWCYHCSSRRLHKNTDSKVLKLIVFDSANFGRRSCSILTRGYGYFMQTRHLYVLIHIWNKGEVGAWNWSFQGGTSFVYICVIYVLCLSCLCICSLLPCVHLLGKGWPLGSCLWCLIVFCRFPMWYPWSYVALDCIDSWSLPSFLLSLVAHRTILVTKCIQINWACKPVKAVISSDNMWSWLLIYPFIHWINKISVLLSWFVYQIEIKCFVKLWVMLNFFHVHIRITELHASCEKWEFSFWEYFLWTFPGCCEIWFSVSNLLLITHGYSTHYFWNFLQWQ